MFVVAGAIGGAALAYGAGAGAVTILGAAATGAAHLPKNPFGGIYQMGNMNFGAGIGTKNYVQATNVPGTLAELFDIKHDDGVYNTGSIRANRAFTSATVNLTYSQ